MAFTTEIAIHAAQEAPEPFKVNAAAMGATIAAQAKRQSAALWHFTKTRALPFAARNSWRALKFTGRAVAFGCRKTFIPWFHENMPRRNLLPRATGLREPMGYVHAGFLGAALFCVVAASGGAEAIDARLQAPINACLTNATAALAPYTGNNSSINGAAPAPSGRYADYTRLTGIYVHAPSTVTNAIVDGCHNSAVRAGIPAAVADGTLPAVSTWLADLNQRQAHALAEEAARVAASQHTAARLAEIQAERVANGRRLNTAYLQHRAIRGLHAEEGPDGRVRGVLASSVIATDPVPVKPAITPSAEPLVLVSEPSGS